jgi:hypothetical protein
MKPLPGWVGRALVNRHAAGPRFRVCRSFRKGSNQLLALKFNDLSPTFPVPYNHSRLIFGWTDGTLFKSRPAGTSWARQNFSDFSNYEDAYEGNLSKLLRHHQLSGLPSYLCVICVRLSGAVCASKGDRTCSAGLVSHFRRSEVTLMYLVRLTKDT